MPVMVQMGGVEFARLAMASYGLTFSAGIPILLSRLNSVDLPTFGIPAGAQRHCFTLWKLWCLHYALG